MRFCSIASGSSGNCIYIGNGNTHLLIDTGISKKKIEEGLDKLGLTGNDITAILITHEHVDHIQGLGVFCRKYQVPIYATCGTVKGILDYKGLGRLPDGLLHEIKVGEPFKVQNIQVYPFAISHDANEPSAYRIESDGKKIAVATDLGEYDDKIVANLQGLDGILLEANHDVHMLEAGPYPFQLKRRILGRKGHLSNETAGQLLNELLHDKMKHIVLGHLSKENNYAELAYETVCCEVNMGDTPYNSGDFPITVAKRDTMSEVIYI